MTPFDSAPNRRVLVVDDNPAIHEDFAKVLAARKRSNSLRSLEESMFGQPTAEPAPAKEGFELGFASQGQLALQMVKKGLEEGRPYAMAFVDIRMPPGWDGVETAARMWEADPRLQVVICSAYSDYSWEQMNQRLGARQQLLILKKPFDAIEVLQLAHALTEKWDLLVASKRSMDELEAAVAERTRSLEQAEAKLSHSMRLAALGRLAGGIAHEINNPLSFIVTNLRFIDEVIRELETPISGSEDLGQATADALNGAERIRRIVRDVKIFGQAEAAPIAEVKLATVVNRALEMARNELEVKVDPQVDLGDVSSLQASEEGLVQVLHNLLLNAAHAMTPQHKATNRISLTARRQGALVTLEVTDNGKGIAPENLPRVFEPFFTTKDVGAGTGLGLCICHGIVARLKGEISVQSEPGVKTSFTISLPAVEAIRVAA